MRTLRISLALSAAILLVALPVFAKKTKKDELATEEKAAANVVKPDTAEDKAAITGDAARDKAIAGKEKRLHEVRVRQIGEMRKILRKNPLYKKKADLLFRIAEKEWDEAKYQYFLERAQYEKQYEAYLSGTLKKKPDEPAADYGKAIKEYKKLLKEFPNYKRLDEVMFYLGRGLGVAGKQKEGASYMLRLTKEYQKSKYITQAYLAVAEYYFDNDLLFAAKTNYLKVLEDKKSTQYPYALYKLGYVHYNLKEYRDGIKSFHRVVELSAGKDKRKVYFTNQAYSALTLSYAEIPDGWKEARDYYTKAGGKELATRYLERIARIYNTQDKTDDEIATYEYLISAEKQGKKVPEYAGYITGAYKKLENMEKTDEVINRFLGTFDPKSSWFTVNKDQEEAMIRAKQYREEEMEWLLSWYHTKAQEVEKLKDLERADQYYRSAAKYYERYLSAFPQGKDNYEKHFFLAEIYFFQTKQWDDSITHYKRVVEIDKKGKFSVESAYAVILAAEQKMADAGLIERPSTEVKKGKNVKKGKVKNAQVEYVKRQKGDKEFKPEPKMELHETETAFVKACGDYVETYPKDKDVPSVSFRSAEIYIKKGHYAEGINRLEVIMEHHATHRFAGFAAATLFDSNYRLRRWDQMERWARYMLERKNYQVLKKNQLQDVIAVSINNYATELNDEGKAIAKTGEIAKSRELKQKAVDEWLRYINEFGGDKKQQEKAAIALFNAAATTEGLEQTERAIGLYEMLIKRYKKSSQATEAHFVLGALYESQTDFETAAGYFEKMASFPDVPQMADALYNAGAIRSALEQNGKAIAILETYIKKFPERDDTIEVHLQIAELYEREKNWSKALATYRNWLKKWSKKAPETVPSVHLRMAFVYQKEGGKRSRRDATSSAGASLKTFAKLPEASQEKLEVRRAAAQAKFVLAEYVYGDYSEVQVSFPDSVLRRSLVKKGQLLQDQEKLMFEVLDFKAHEISAGALYRIGEAYYLFAKSLFDLPIPSELNEDEQFIYRAELDDRAAPLQEKAIEAMQSALRLAHKNNVYNEWSQRSAALLVKLSPEAFPVLEDAAVNTDWRTPSTFSTGFIEDPAGKLALIKKAEPKPAPKVAPGEAPKGGDAAPAGADETPSAAKEVDGAAMATDTKSTDNAK